MPLACTPESLGQWLRPHLRSKRPADLQESHRRGHIQRSGTAGRIEQESRPTSRGCACACVSV